MQRKVLIEISLNDKSMFETAEKKFDITEDVFESMSEAIVEAIKENINLDDDDFVNSILENYHQKLPEDFKNLKDMGFGIKVEDKKSSSHSKN